MAKSTIKLGDSTGDGPVLNPTWYGNIRSMFNRQDIQHMRSVGIDLSIYGDVKMHASNIYQQVATGNMPPGNPWSQDEVNTFLNWMKNDYPKGTPPVQSAALLKKVGATATRIRKEITALSSTELDTLKKAFTGIMALPTTDTNSYFNQAGIHWLPEPNTWCMHHDPGYNPWHRAYLLSFENALRSVPGCENVTLPYWDITTPVPDVLKAAPFDAYTLPVSVGQGYDAGYVTTRFDYPTIQQNLLNSGVTAKINKAMAQTDWEDFHGYFAGAPNNTIISAHDNGHNSIGPTMADQSVAAFDPIFWFFHCNWDRLFWQWQEQMQATDLEGLLNTINKTTDPVSYQIFTIPALMALPPFTSSSPNVNTVQIIDSVNSLGVDYQAPQSFKAKAMVAKTQRNTLTSQKFSVNTELVNVRVNGLNRLKIPGSFFVHLLKDDKVIATTSFFQPNEVEKCANCVKNAIVHFDFELPLKTVSNGKLGIWVEPVNKDFVGDHFPHKLMGNPTVDVHFLLSTE